MIRKQTWILLGVFVVLLGAAFYLQKNPLPDSASLTPSPTSAPVVLAGWSSGDIVSMESKDSQGQSVLITQDAQGSWSLGPNSKQKVETGLAEEIRSQVVEFRAVTTLPADFQLGAVGLQAPTRSLVLRDKQGKQVELRIGSATPTGDGYYIQVDNQAPVVVNKSTIDGTLDLFNNALPTPTPPPATPSAANQQQTSTP
jgi:hypothetical protein